MLSPRHRMELKSWSEKINRAYFEAVQSLTENRQSDALEVLETVVSETRALQGLIRQEEIPCLGYNIKP